MATASQAPDDGGRKKTWVIIGASRGIGHEFGKQLLARGDQVYATVRGETAEYFVQSKDLCRVLNCNVTNEASINVRLAS